MEWEINCLLRDFGRKMKETKTEEEGDELQKLYAGAILHTSHFDTLVLPLDDFMDDVRSGHLNDYDGGGFFIDAEGNKIPDLRLRCDVKVIEKAKKVATYAVWHNA